VEVLLKVEVIDCNLRVGGEEFICFLQRIDAETVEI
jgi:hypothetical protein